MLLVYVVCLNIFCWSLIWMLQCPKVLRFFLYVLQSESQLFSCHLYESVLFHLGCPCLVKNQSYLRIVVGHWTQSGLFLYSFLVPHIIFDGIILHSWGLWQYIVTFIHNCAKYLKCEFSAFSPSCEVILGDLVYVTLKYQGYKFGCYVLLAQLAVGNVYF